MSTQFTTPILFLIFNRPEVTEEVFNEIRKQKPKYLFIAADGPRKNKKGEKEKCEKTRDAVLQLIDWNCEYKLLFREQNLGCREAVSSAISWFFEQVDEGIILEDDCLPHPSFFFFCSELLEKYRDDGRILHISGDNFQTGIKRGDADYYFSIHNHIWGWATWKRAWKLYDVDMSGYTRESSTKYVRKINRDPSFSTYWLDLFDQIHAKEIDTWDWQWTYAIWKNGGLSIIPQVNLVSNIGFGPDGTHTKIVSKVANLPITGLELKNHPQNIYANKKADNYTSKYIFSISLRGDKLNLKTMKRGVGNALRSGLRAARILRHKLRLLSDEQYRKLTRERQEIDRLSRLPRFEPTYTNINGQKLKIPDAASYLFISREMFENEIYKFTCKSKSPFIIDCGANIGLSIIYFKQLFPSAEITAFEPDPIIFNYLKENVQSLGLQNIKLLNLGLWNEEKELDFFAEGADGGRLVNDEAGQGKSIKVKTIKLSSVLQRKVDFLKIDIEGAEFQVLKECESALHMVEKLFVEYHSFSEEEQCLSELLGLLKNVGFRYYIQHVGVFSPHPFVQINQYSGMDLQLNIFAYRL